VETETGIPSGDLIAGFIQAGGTAAIMGEGTILENAYPGEAACIKADSIVIDIRKSFGSIENPFQLDTAAGKSGAGSLSVAAETIYAEEVSGDLKLKEIAANGKDASGDSMILTAPGSILAADSNSDAITEAADAQKEANDALDKAEHAKDKADALELDVTAKEAELDAAKAAAQEAAEAAQEKETAAERLTRPKRGSEQHLNTGFPGAIRGIFSRRNSEETPRRVTGR